ncbi:coproporphyrinogen III oxidase [Nocardioides baekrokdamisoli]|uniref:Heme chaperone HemW n=1 Tax=Nocardioides baekrokdamisoli TaxID=1804624 RepID=A0A3G9ICJ9_9ACTN|nr:radical SAM family heme chaperone HemW [Nocardioides baekrokdamisoli]BBH16092.1 coproporphyrinogen III oxidase [Nocardioides baekrokdamisoli]
MPSALPDGEPAPADGSLPTTLSGRGLGFYVHVPFCSVRCGYCDFNTYTATELGPGVSQSTYASQAIAEIELSRRILGPATVDTVFFGGGTPTLLPAEDLVAMLVAIRDQFDLATDAEITTEANPDSVSLESLQTLREGGFTRISFGMQSAVPHVLAVLDRTHDPARVPQAVAWAREAGFEQVSLDLIYGTPGESMADWEASLDAALTCDPNHISAYSLIVEDGTALARRVRRGEVPMPEEDDFADKYEVADRMLRARGFGWYEVSNWATSTDARCRHNMLYWQGGDWWGIGPGAHSHVNGTRWWNAKHPTAYAARLAAGESPAAGRELLTDEDRRIERVLLELRLSDGMPTAVIGNEQAIDAQVGRGLLQRRGERLVLTDAGRLLADGVVRDLLD